MDEKCMINDALGVTKASLGSYKHAITECSNQQLRSTLQQLRDEAEQFQYQLYEIAEQKGYYVPAAAADSNDIQQVKSGLTGGGTMK